MRFSDNRSIKKILVALSSLCFLAFSICVRANDSEQAKIEFEKGVANFLDKKYKAALNSFEESYRIKKKTTVLFNIAMCQKALGDYISSTHTFHQLLEEEGSEMEPKMRVKAEEALQDMALKLGHIYLKEAADEADVFLDGRNIATTPLNAPLTVNPGNHVITIIKQGFTNWSQELEVSEGTDLDILVRLEPIAVQEAVSPVATEKTERPPTNFREKKSDSAWSSLMIGGTVSLALSAGAGALGVYYSVRSSRDVEKGKELTDKMETPANEAEYLTLEEKYNAIRKYDLPKHRAGAIVGYALAGTLIATGVVLILVDKFGSESIKKVAVTPAVGGVNVQF